PIAEHPAQGCDVDAQIGLFDMDVRPDQIHQIVLADHLSASLDQCDQDLHGAAAEVQRTVALEEDPLLRQQTIWPESDALAGCSAIRGPVDALDHGAPILRTGCRNFFTSARAGVERRRHAGTETASLFWKRARVSE